MMNDFMTQYIPAFGGVTVVDRKACIHVQCGVVLVFPCGTNVGTSTRLSDQTDSIPYPVGYLNPAIYYYTINYLVK